MRKKILGLGLAFTMISCLSYGQSLSNHVDVDWGKAGQGSAYAAEVEKFLETENYYFAVKNEKKFVVIPIVNLIVHYNKYYIDQFDKDLNFISSYDMGKYFKGYDQEGIYEANNNIFMLSSKRSADKSSKVLYIETLDKKKNAPKGDRVEIARLSAEKKVKKIAFDFFKSEEESKLGVMIHYPYKKNELDKVALHVFDTDLNKIWSIEKHEFDYADKDYIIDNFILNEFGELFILGHRFVKRKEAKLEGLGGKYNDYFLTSFINEGKSVKSFDIGMENYYFTDIEMKIGNENNLYTVGYYSNSRFSSSAEGVFTCNLNPVNEDISDFKAQNFPNGLLVEGAGLKAQKKADKAKSKGKNLEAGALIVTDVIVDDNGNLKIIGEQRTRITRTNSQTNQTTITYDYRDIYVSSYNTKNQEFEWSTKVAKRHVYTHDNRLPPIGLPFIGYTVGEKDGNLYISYYDNEENYLVDADQTKRGVKRAVINKKKGLMSLSLITSDGSVTKERLFKSVEERFLVATRGSTQINDTDIVIFGQGKKKIFKIGKMSIK